MIYEDLYRQYEQNDVMHRGVCAVELAEKEVDPIYSHPCLKRIAI